MKHFAYFPLITLLLLIQTQSATASFNPIAWLLNKDEAPKLEPLYAVSESEERDAARLLDKGIAKFDNGSYLSAERLFKKTIKNYPTTAAAGEALYLRGRISMQKARWIKAFELFQELISKYPNYPEINQVIAAQFDCASALMNGARGRIFVIIPTFKQYAVAISEFETIVNNAPYGDYATLALMNIADLAERRKERDLAIDALDRLINYYPDSELAPNAFSKLAGIYASLVNGNEYDQGATRQAISYYEDFLALFPDNESVGEVEANLRKMENLLSSSRLTLGDFYYLHRNNNTAALIFYNEAITIAPDSEAAERARKQIHNIESGVRPFKGSRFFRKILFVN